MACQSLAGDVVIVVTKYADKRINSFQCLGIALAGDLKLGARARVFRIWQERGWHLPFQSNRRAG